ncbi:hypothetical protein ACOME3_009432 [Neoechinorhynchus agilis]
MRKEIDALLDRILIPQLESIEHKSERKGCFGENIVLSLAKTAHEINVSVHGERILFQPILVLVWAMTIHQSVIPCSPDILIEYFQLLCDLVEYSRRYQQYSVPKFCSILSRAIPPAEKELTRYYLSEMSCNLLIADVVAKVCKFIHANKILGNHSEGLHDSLSDFSILSDEGNRAIDSFSEQAQLTLVDYLTRLNQYVIKEIQCMTVVNISSSKIIHLTSWKSLLMLKYFTIVNSIISSVTGMYESEGRFSSKIINDIASALSLAESIGIILKDVISIHSIDMLTNEIVENACWVLFHLTSRSHAVSERILNDSSMDFLKDMITTIKKFGSDPEPRSYTISYLLLCSLGNFSVDPKNPLFKSLLKQSQESDSLDLLGSLTRLPTFNDYCNKESQSGMDGISLLKSRCLTSFHNSLLAAYTALILGVSIHSHTLVRYKFRQLVSDKIILLMINLIKKMYKYICELRVCAKANTDCVTNDFSVFSDVSAYKDLEECTDQICMDENVNVHLLPYSTQRKIFMFRTVKVLRSTLNDYKNDRGSELK